MVTHPSTNMAECGWESNSQSVDYKSDDLDLTTTLLSNLHNCSITSEMFHKQEGTSELSSAECITLEGEN